MTKLEITVSKIRCFMDKDGTERIEETYTHEINEEDLFSIIKGSE